MAEMGANLAKVVIVGTISKVMSAIAEESELKERVQNDMEFMTAEFQMMQAFLGVADEERVNNSVVRTWVRQVRDLAYDVEDYFEVFLHHDLQTSTTWWWRIVPLPSCMAPPLPLDQAVASIKRLRARVEDVSQRNLRYRLIGDSGSKPIPQDQTAEATFGTLRGLVEAEWKQRDLRELTALITRNLRQPLEVISVRQPLEVISVWAAAGDSTLRATSIIRKVFADPGICKGFPSRAWARPMHPFNPEEFLRSLLTQFHANSLDHEFGAGEILGAHLPSKKSAADDTKDDLIKQLLQQMKLQRYLVVIEDLTTLVEWDAIIMYLTDGNNGSRIIVSTQQMSIASVCTGEPYQVSGLTELPDDKSVCVFFNEGSGHALSFDDMRKEASESVKKFKLFGRYNEMHQLDRHINLAAGPDVGVHVSSVWGIAGVGKSVLVRTLYYNQMLSDDSIFGQYSWVNVPHPFSLAEFSRRLRRWYCRPQADDTSARLIVIDNLRSAEEWDLIRASLSMGTHYTVIVVTDDESVAKHCAKDEDSVLNIKCLESDTATDLNKKELHRLYPVLDAPDLGGLPKVVVNLAHNFEWYSPRRGLVIRVLENKPAFASLHGLIGWMKFFFRTCPDSLKPFVYYMCVFPAKHKIRQRRLVRRWIAEGYSNDTDAPRAEEYLDEIFSKLVNLSIIQRSSKDRMGMVNGFLLEYMLSQPMEDNLVFVLDTDCSQPSQHRERHLSIRDKGIQGIDERVYGTIDLSRLRSLTVFGTWRRHFVPCKMLLLNVLDLEGTQYLRDDDLSVIEWAIWVPRLKFLSLRGCENITRLPSSLFGLKLLQTLDVRGTSITKLPPAMIKLQKLQYLRAGRPFIPLDEGEDTTDTSAEPAGEDASVSCTPATSWWSKFRAARPYNRGVAVPQGMFKLETLHTIGVVDVGAAGGKASHLLGILWMSWGLRKLGVSGINRENVRSLYYALWKGGYKWNSLSVQLDKDNEGYCGQLDDADPLEDLRSLKLYGPIGKFPAKWIGRLHRLRKLTLELIILSREDMGVIRRLWELHTLRLFVNQFENDELSMSAAVVDLELACKSSLHVTFEGEAMEKLEVIKVLHSSGSGTQTKISGLQNLKRLREVCIKGPRDETLEEDLKRQIDNYPTKPGLMGPVLRVDTGTRYARWSHYGN